MLPNIVRISFIIISWSTVFFLRKNTIKRYIPVALFASQLVVAVYQMAHYFKWWKLKRPLFPWNRVFDPFFIFGPFLIGTIWIFHLTSKYKVHVYLFLNFTIDAFFAFFVLPFCEKLGLVKLINISRSSIYYIMVTLSIIIYPYHKWQEGIFKKD